MSRPTIPHDLTGKALIDYLVANKGSILAAKKAMPIKFSDVVVCKTSFVDRAEKSAGGKLFLPAKDAEDTGAIRVKVIANTAWWCDSQMDVLTDSCWNKSIADKGNNIPHIHDHEYKSTSHVGDVRNVYGQQIPWSQLGVLHEGTTTALVFETDIRKDYNEQVYKFYRNGKINQHSIGLQYVSIGLAVNDKEHADEYALWEKYIHKVPNKSVAEEAGYFYFVPEIRLLENSCVLYGANSLTPTLEIEDISKNANIYNDLNTDEQPPISGTGEQPLKGIDFKSLLNVFNNEPEIKDR